MSCFENAGVKPKPLGIRAVAGVFMMLGFGMIIGCMILGLEHVAFKYYLPSLRKKPKDSFWRSLNLMLFSQVSLVLLKTEFESELQVSLNLSQESFSHRLSEKQFIIKERFIYDNLSFHFINIHNLFFSLFFCILLSCSS